MSATSLTRRDVLATTAAAAALSLLGEHMPHAAEGHNAMRPFRINVPEPELVDLRRRINATKWPERETVTDASQGVQLATPRNSPAIGQQMTTGARSRRG